MVKILVIAPHPDDIEFACGGILIKEADKGAKLKYVICTLGEAGSSGSPEIRKREAEAAAKLIGASIEFLNLGGDCHIEYKPENTIKIAKIIREFKPQIVLTTQPEPNQHPDHSNLSHVVMDACRFARFKGLKELLDLPIHQIDALYYFPSGAQSEKPDILIDITDQFDRWQELIKCHESQMKTVKFLELTASMASSYGRSIGTLYALPLWVNNPIRVDCISDLQLSSRHYYEKP